MAEQLDHHLRPATEADLPVLLALWHQLEQAQADARVMPRVADAEARIEAVFREALADPDATVVIAEADGQPVGMALLRFEGPRERSLSGGATVELSRVVVTQQARGAGIGTALVLRAEAFARERGATWLSAKVFARNEGARAFWAREGFAVHYESHVRRVE